MSKKVAVKALVRKSKVRLDGWSREGVFIIRRLQSDQEQCYVPNRDVQAIRGIIGSS